MKQKLAAYPLCIEQDVIWGDMDAFGHLNNIKYFRYFESSRIALFEKMGVESFTGTESVGPILGETKCRFRFPLTYPDRVTIGIGVSEISEDRFVTKNLVVSHTHSVVAAEGEATVVSFDYPNGKKAAIPDEVRAALEAMRLRE